VATWRGWAAGGSDGAHEVTSARLSGEARPRNRLFPKTRSWFALDAPLELLSPLSVLRVLFAVATLAWPLIGWIGRADHGSRMAAVVAVSVTNTLLWVGLLAVKKVDLRACRLLSAWWTVAVGVLVWSGGGTGASLSFALFTVPIAVFVALYLGNRAVVVDLIGTAAVLGTALAPSEGVARALLLACFGVVALATAPAAVLVLGRSARRHDTVDPDTGLPNGFGLAQRLEARDSTPFVVAAVVLEGIGNAREALGYQVGTELLRRAVEDLGQVLPSDAVIGRVDGDELLVVVGLHSGGADPPPSSTGPDRVGVPGPAAREGSQLADTLVRAVSAGRYLVGAIEVSLRAHVGLSTAPFDGTDVAELVRRASVTARHAAERGVAVQSWDGDQGALTADDLSLLGDLRLAPERGELFLNYQPQVARTTGRARSVEALLRWDSPVHGLVSPGRFIPLAERTGLIDRLTEWVMREALDAQVRWREAGVDLPVSVNVSPRSLPMPGLSSSILDLLAERDLPASCLTVEVTETAVADPEQAASVLRPLYDHGIRISVDDFGTGFTSLAALPTLPLDELKVDQCFVMRSPNSPADRAIVRTVGELGHRLGLEVVAEGVETAEIAGLLGDMGIDLLQGYHFARPLPEDELLRFMADEAQSGPASPPAGSAIPATPATPATPAAPARMITRVPVDGADHRVGHPTLG
jgi:EAL domain-containing protein (putative c-di-GMP-specific phosphodiesterase class I)/GGDEF domain-containing protein